jgi:hypothetical protein
MSYSPLVYRTSDGSVVFKTLNDKLLYKYGTYTYDERASNPKVMLQWSDDGGYNWSNEYWTRAGRTGEFKSMVNWHRLGMSRDRVFRVTVTDPVKWVLIDARIDVGKENK